MEVVRERWLDYAQVAGRRLGSGTGPIVLLLGSGASRSSGAPTNGDIETSYLTTQKVGAAQLADAMKVISGHEKTTSIVPLFSDLQPYLGFRCLAALARERPVIVITTAWDDALGLACEAQGVRHQSHSLLEATDTATALDTDAPGVVCLHLHGSLVTGGTLHFERFPTFSLYGGAERDVLTQALRRVSVVIGVPLPQADTLLTFFESANAAFPPPQGSIDVFARSDEHAHHRDRRWEDPPRDGRIHRAADIDFDRAVLAMAEEIRGYPFDDVAQAVDIELPAGADLVLPKPSLLRGALDHQVVVFAGEPRLGKTTAAAVLAHWHGLCRPGTEIIPAEGAAGAARVLDAATSSPGHRVLLLDDPFACDDAALRDDILARLAEFGRSQSDSRIYVTTRLFPWLRVIGPEPPSGISVTSTRPSDWYSPEMLSAMSRRSAAHRADERDALLERIALGELLTPSRLSAVISAYDASIVDDKQHCIDHCWDTLALRPIALYLAAARLQELSLGTFPEHVLRAAVGTELPASAETVLPAFLGQHSFDTVEYVRLAHYTDRIAIDRFLAKNHKDVEAALDAAGGCPVGWARTAITTWSMSQHILDSCATTAMLANSTPALVVPLLLEWGGEMLADITRRDAAKGRQAVGVLAEQPHDFWSKRELVYQVVGDWEILNHGSADDARQFLRSTLGDVALMGCYSVLEACLYYQHASDPYVRAQMLAALTDRIEDARRPGASLVTLREVALAFDALLWRLPPIDTSQLHHLVGEIIDSIDENPALAGAIAAATLFHGDDDVMTRTAFAPFRTLVRGDRTQARCAADLVKWHFLHQSRGRALFNRRLLESERSGYLNRRPSRTVLSVRRRALIEEALETLAAVPSTAGWIVHLGINLRCTAGVFDITAVAKALETVRAGDDGVITAALTYEPPKELIPAFKDYFRDTRSSERMQEIMSGGVTVRIGDAETNAAEPRFRFAAAADDTWTRLDLDGAVTAHHLALSKVRPSQVEQALRNAIRQIRDSIEPVDLRVENEVLRLVRTGDLRVLERAGARREDKEPDFVGLVQLALASVKARLDLE